MSTTKPFSQWTVIALREFLKERCVRSSGLKAQLVYRGPMFLFSCGSNQHCHLTVNS
jgi:hypothetical protein